MRKGLTVLAGVVATGVVSGLIVNRVMKNTQQFKEYACEFDDEIDDWDGDEVYEGADEK